jgi:hypothetical protein
LNDVEEQADPAPHSRIGPTLILLSAPLLYIGGILGAHGGGFGTGAALFMSLLCLPVGLLTMIWGLSTRPRSFGWWFTRGYLLACAVTLALAWYDLAS